MKEVVRVATAAIWFQVGALLRSVMLTAKTYKFIAVRGKASASRNFHKINIGHVIPFDNTKLLYIKNTKMIYIKNCAHYLEVFARHQETFF